MQNICLRIIGLTLMLFAFMTFSALAQQRPILDNISNSSKMLNIAEKPKPPIDTPDPPPRPNPRG